jgi:hypothetical protein
MNNLAHAYFKNKEYKNAVISFEKCFQLAPDQIKGHNRLDLTYYGLIISLVKCEKFSKAEEWLQLYIQVMQSKGDIKDPKNMNSLKILNKLKEVLKDPNVTAVSECPVEDIEENKNSSPISGGVIGLWSLVTLNYL